VWGKQTARGLMVGLLLRTLLLIPQEMKIIPAPAIHGNVYILFLSSCIAAPVYEELLFRGLLFNYALKILPAISPRRLVATEQKMVVVTAFMITTITFTFAHMKTPIILILLFVNSLIITYLYHKTSNLISPSLLTPYTISFR
jgi:membrane protease YdiL (CAAX protease family)